MKPVIAIVGALSAGSTATLLEFLASALGLVIAANLQSAVTLTSRRRLFVRGSATLRDATWGMSITDGLANPRRMFKDRRSLFAVALAVIVLLLVGLTVFQAQPGDSCSFEAESTWSIERKELGCYEYSLEAEMGSAARYFAQALEKVSNVDVDVGIPENTDVFEDSILTRASVTSLKSLENRFVASILQTGKISNARFDRTAASIHPLCFEKSGERHDNLCWQSDYQLDINPVNWTREDHIWYTAPIGLEATGNASIVMSSGFAWAQTLYHGNYVPQYEDHVPVDAECDIFEVGRDGAYSRNEQQYVEYLATSNEDSEDIGEHQVRRGVLASIVARKSASQKNAGAT